MYQETSCLKMKVKIKTEHKEIEKIKLKMKTMFKKLQHTNLACSAYIHSILILRGAYMTIVWTDLIEKFQV